MQYKLFIWVVFVFIIILVAIKTGSTVALDIIFESSMLWLLGGHSPTPLLHPPLYLDPFESSSKLSLYIGRHGYCAYIVVMKTMMRNHLIGFPLLQRLKIRRRQAGDT